MSSLKIFKRVISSVSKRYGSIIYRNRINYFEKQKIDEIDNLHFNILKKELKEAQNLIDFYKSKDYKNAISSKNLEDFLGNLPIMDKQDLIKKNFFPSSWASNKKKHTTSGSSGTPLTIYSSISEKLYSQAILYNQIRKITGKWGMKNMLALSGFYVNPDLNVQNFYVRDIFSNEIFMSIYHMIPENSDKYAKLVNESDIDIIYGYASAINELANLVNGKLKCNIKMIITTSEVLTDNYRRNIEKTFGAKVFDLYGAQEGGHFAFECKYGVKHIHPARGIVEVKNEKGIFREGKGQAIVTPINKPSFPIFRYNMKDIIEIKKLTEKCNCGLHTYVITEIDGRSEDLVKCIDGRKIGYLNFHATKDLSGILESQLIQKDYTHFDFLIKFSNENENENENEKIFRGIKSKIEERLGYNVDINFKIVEKIEKSSRGKFKAVIVKEF